MTDPELLAERRRVWECLADLTERYAVLTKEFDRRAGAKWTQAS